MATVSVVYRYRWLALGLAFASQTCNALASQSVAPLAPLFQPELGLSKTEVGFFSAATFLGAWGVLLFAGWLCDRFGVRKVMSAGVIVTGVFMLAMTTAASFLQAVAVMFMTGIGRGTVPPGTSKAIMEWFPPTSRATAMGVKLTGMPTGGIVTAALLPSLALAIGWRSAMATVGLAIIAIGLVTAIFYRDALSGDRGTRTIAGQRSGLSEMLRGHRIWALSAVSLLFMTAQTSVMTYLPLYFKEVALLTSVPDEAARIVAAGGFLAVCQVGGVFARVLWGGVSDRVFHGRRMMLTALVGALAACSLALLGFLGSESPTWLLVACAFGSGATVLGWNGLLQTAVCEVTGSKLAASAAGFSATVSQVGLVGGPPFLGLVVDVAGSYRPAWLVAAGFALAGAVLAMSLSRRESGEA